MEDGAYKCVHSCDTYPWRLWKVVQAGVVIARSALGAGNDRTHAITVHVIIIGLPLLKSHRKALR